jgi:hypothetical protein
MLRLSFITALLIAICVQPLKASVWTNYNGNWDPAIPLPNLADLSKKINSPEFLASAAAKAGYNADTADLAKFTRITIQPGREGLSIRIEASPPDKDRRFDPIDSYFDTLSVSIAQVLAESQRSLLDESLALRARTVNIAADDLSKVNAQIQDLRAQLRKSTGRLDVSPAGLRQAIASLDQEQQKLSLDAAGLTVRKNAMEAAVADLAKKAATTAEQDPVSQELASIVTLRERELARMKELQKQATISASEVDKAQANLAEARARLLERRSTTARSSGGDALSEFNHELTLLSINVVENQARREFVKNSLDRLAPTADQIDELESLTTARARAQDALVTAQSQLAVLRTQLSTIRPPYLTHVSPSH